MLLFTKATRSIRLSCCASRVLEETRDTANWAYALTIQGNAYARKNDYAKCLELNKKAFLLRRAIGLKGVMLENINNMARSLGKLNNWQAALDTLSSAEKLMAETGFRNGQHFIQATTGEALFHLNRLSEADPILLENFEFCRARKIYNVAAPTADLLSKSKKMQGKLAESLYFREQNVSIKDTLASKEKEKIIQETAAKYETREKQAQIASLERENQLARERNFWIGGLSSLLLISGVWFARFRQRKLKEAAEKDLAAAELKSDLLLAREQMLAQTIEKQQTELENNQQQLADFTTHLIEKKHQIEALQNKLDAASVPGEARESNGKIAAEEDIEALYGQRLFTDSDWATFRKYFEKVFPGFFGQLKLNFPELTTAETRLVLLTKMNLSTKEIADLLAISPDSVRRLRSRFKKKTGLSEEELLVGVEA